MTNWVVKIQDNRSLLRLYRAISSVFQVIPYYVFEEPITNRKGDSLQRPHDPHVKTELLGAEDMEILAQSEESVLSADKYRQLLDHGSQCLATRYKGTMVSYAWFNVRELSFKGRVRLMKPDEAYKFDVRTFKAYRTGGWAAHNARELRQKLRSQGIVKVYSITLLYNSDYMRHIRKQGAHPIEFSVYIGIFQKFRFHVRLKTYPSM